MKPTRIFDILPYQLENFPQETAVAAKIDGVYTSYSTNYFLKESTAISKGLIKLGIKKNDKVALVSWNTPQWLFADYGIQHLGAVSVPMYPTITEKDYAYILKDSDVKAVFVQDEDLHQKVTAALKSLEVNVPVYSFNKLDNVKHLDDLKELGKGVADSDLEEFKSQVSTEDLLTLIYTSGTTGDPKGVMITHKNILADAFAIESYIPIDKDSRVLSFLPLCHVFARSMASVYMYKGASIYYAESMETIGENLKEVKPHMFVTVPRLLEKVYDKIYAKGAALTGIKKAMFFWALNLGQRYDVNNELGWWYNFQLGIANKIIFKKWREALGGEVKLIVTGGAAMQKRLIRVFSAGQIPIREGYGLTEVPVVSCNRPNEDQTKIGTVGPIFTECIEVKIAEKSGEILIKGDAVMTGYYNKPEKTAEAIVDGWFHTGDVGTYENGYLQITGRTKEIFKTSGGKYIAPALIENKLKESKVIEQAMVIGENRKFPSVLIVPNFSGLKDWCKIKDIEYTTDVEMIKTPKVLAKFQKECDKYNKNFANYEKVKKFGILHKEWTVETGELTPTMKGKRKVILKNNEDLIEDLYNC
jgi:long-chain acyl-CoA synthetase